MKKKVLLFAGPLAAVVLLFNLQINSKSKAANGVALKNISTMQASAGEMICDASNQNVCTIGKATGTGRLIDKE